MLSLFSGLVPTSLVPHRHPHPLFVSHLPLVCDPCFPLCPSLVFFLHLSLHSPQTRSTFRLTLHTHTTLLVSSFCVSHTPSISLLALFVWASCWCLHPPMSASLVGWHAIVWIAGGTWISSLVVSFGGALPLARPTKHETNRRSCCGMAPPPPQPPPSSGAGAARIANEDEWMEKTTWERERKR